MQKNVKWSLLLMLIVGTLMPLQAQEAECGHKHKSEQCGHKHKKSCDKKKKSHCKSKCSTAISPETAAMVRVDKMVSRFDLTNNQKEELVVLFTAEEKARRANCEQAKGEKKEKMAAKEEMCKKRAADLEKIIGKENMEQLKKNCKGKKESKKKK